MKNNFALLCGTGQLAQAAMEKYPQALCIALTRSAFIEHREFRKNIVFISIGSLGKIIKKLKENDIKSIAVVGKLQKELLFRGLKFDLYTLNIFRKLKDHGDNTIMQKFVDILAEHGIETVGQKEIYKEYLAEKGTLVRSRKLNGLMPSMRYGFQVAKQIAALDIGQSVIVYDKAVVAVEASEGTDAAIIRAGEYLKKDGVLIKVSKPGHTGIYDIPVVGMTTLQNAVDSKISGIVVEAGNTILFPKNDILSYLKKKRIALVSVKNEEDFNSLR